MTKKRARGLRKCVHFNRKNCPYAYLSGGREFKCDICEIHNGIDVTGKTETSQRSSTDTGND
jgi:hypothetical protein